MFLKSIILLHIVLFAVADKPENDDLIVCDSEYVDTLTVPGKQHNIKLNLHTLDDKWSYFPLETQQTCLTFSIESYHSDLLISLATKKNKKYENFLYAEMRSIADTWHIYDYEEDEDVVEVKTKKKLPRWSPSIFWVDWSDDIFRVGYEPDAYNSDDNIYDDNNSDDEQNSEEKSNKNHTIMEYKFAKKLEITHIGLKSVDGDGVKIEMLASNPKCPKSEKVAVDIQCRSLNITTDTYDCTGKLREILHSINSDYKLYKSSEIKSYYTIKSMLYNLVEKYKNALNNYEQCITNLTPETNINLLSNTFEEIKTLYFNFVNELGEKADKYPDVQIENLLPIYSTK